MRPILLSFLICALAAVDPGPPAADGWCGQETILTLDRPGPVCPLIVQGMVPALGEGPFTPTLVVSVDGREMMRSTVGPGAFEVRSVMIAPSGKCRILLAFSDGRPLPAPDNRRVAARLTRVALDRLGTGGNEWRLAGSGEAVDIVAPSGPLGLGAGWYSYEVFQGTAFRWVGSDAEICVRPDAELRLTIDAEPGPALAGKPCDVRITDKNGHLVDKVRIVKRGAYDVVLPAQSSEAQPLRLQIDGPFSVLPGDPRRLCLRVFSIVERP